MDIATETAAAYAAFAAARYSQAADGARRVLRESPADPAALTLVGRLALLSGDPDIAHDVFASVLQKHPRNAALWLDLTAALRDLGCHADALEAAKRAVELKGDNPDGWIRLGEMSLTLNDLAGARDAFRRALELLPNSVAAFRGLCQSEVVTPDAEIVLHMERLAASAMLTAREISQLHYTLAQVYRAAGCADAFVRHLLAANSAQRALCADGRAQYQLIFDRLEAAFTQEAFLQAPRADAIDPVPIFVLGMPRSGTTLTEQLLAAHPAVTAGGELDYMRRSLRRAVEQQTGRLFPEGFETISAAGVSEIARAYARRLSFIGKGTRFVTDKTPGNFHLLGLLRTIFPNCRIVHVTRDPMDTCFSILQYPFDDRSPHTCDMRLLAYVYARYRRLMRLWQTLFPGEFITIEYERLVRSPQEEGRRIFQFCGLEWRDEYLEFHRSSRAVRTFSSVQVRQPIYTSSIGAWQTFADALAPLREAVQTELKMIQTCAVRRKTGRKS